VSRASLLRAALGAAIGAALVLRPLAHGVPPATVLAFWATALGLAVVPGVMLCHGARLSPAGDPWLLLGQGATAGLALHGLAFLAGRPLGAPWLPSAVALAAAALGLALRVRRVGGAPAPAPPPASPSLTLAVVLAACLVQPLASVARLGEPVPSDLLFHAGNAAELRHRWPLQDPRVAGLPLNYHLLAYAMPIDAAERAGAPVADPLLALGPLLWLGLLSLQVANVGRVLLHDGRGGPLGAVIVLLHADPGRVLGLGAGAFNSHFAAGVYGSPTTVTGLALLAGLAIAIARWLDAGDRRSALAALLLAAAVSAAKATVLPAVLGGLGLCGAYAAVRGRRTEAVRALVAAFALGVAGLPFTWAVASGESSYRTILRWGPGALFLQAPFTAAARAVIGLGEGVSLGAWAVPLFPIWLVGYLGLAGVGVVAWVLVHQEPLDAGQRWALATAAAGGGLALAFDAQGLSQLFFAYNGQLLLASFAGAALVLAPSRRGHALAAALALCAVPSAEAAARLLQGALCADWAAAVRPSSPPLADYLDGLSWLRAHAVRDAVVFADNPAFLLSGIGEVRLYYENAIYTPRGWERRWGGDTDPFPERAALQERLLRRPDAGAVAAARRAVGPGPRLLVVADHVPSRIESGIVHASPGAVPRRRLFPEDLFALRFANGSMQVYEALEADAR
jgi:hypothetical protein